MLSLLNWRVKCSGPNCSVSIALGSQGCKFWGMLVLFFELKIERRASNE